MANGSTFDRCGLYQIVVEGVLDKKWESWFEDFTITQRENGKSVFTGKVMDQAALYGLIARISNIGLPLISVQCMITNCEEEPGQCIQQAIQQEIALQRRAFQTEKDYCRIRDFLQQTLVHNGLQELSWAPARLDFWRWHINENLTHKDLSEVIHLWETPEGDIAAVLTPDGEGNAFFHIHPHFQTPVLEAAMVETAETFLIDTQSNGTAHLTIWTHQANESRQWLLEDRGYTRGEPAGYYRRQELCMPIPAPTIPEGYTIRALALDEEDLPARSWASWRVYHPDAPDEEYEGWRWYLKIQQAPLYRQDLDLVAAAPDGSIAAFCTVWFDGVSRTGTVVFVGTVPEHQRQGLSRAVLLEALRRLQQKGAAAVFVASYNPAAHALFESVGFKEYDVFYPWVREGGFNTEPQRAQGFFRGVR